MKPWPYLSSLLSFLFIFIGLFMFIGCSSPNTSKAPSKTITLEFWTIQLLSFSDMLEPMFEEFESTHPHIKIKWVDVPGSVIEKRILTAIMSPHVPDVVNLNPDYSALLASRKALVNMNQAVSPKIKDTYLPAAWKASSLGDFAFGLPWYITSKVTFYNQHLLKEAGFSKPPMTFNELFQFSKKLREKTNAYATMPNISVRGNFLKELQKSGIQPYDEKGHAVFADRGASRYLDPWVDMYQNEWVPAESLIEGPEGAPDRYQSGTLALLMTGVNFGNKVKENAPDVFSHTGVSPQFPTDSASTDFSTMVLVVPQKSEHPKEAVEFALFMTNKTNQLKFCHRAPILPSIIEALEAPLFQKHQSSDIMEKAISMSARQLREAKDVYQIRPQQKKINEIMDYYVQLTMLGKMKSQPAMAQAQQEINHILFEGDSSPPDSP